MKRQEADPVALTEASIEAYKELLSTYQSEVNSLFIGDILTEVANSLGELSVSLDARQVSALADIVEINKDSLLAIDSARTVVTKLYSVVKLAVFAVNYDNTEEVYVAAIQVFLTKSTDILPELESSIEKMVLVIADAGKGKFWASKTFFITNCVINIYYSFKRDIYKA